MEEGDDGRVVEDHRQEVLQLGAARGGVERITHRVLHPGVGGQDDVGGDRRSDRGDPDGCQVDLLREAVPAEDPEAQEGRLEEEREQTLDRQRSPEDVADEPAVGAPVHPELELLDDPRDHAEREVDEEQLAEEACQAQVLRVAGAHPGGLQAGHEERQPDRQGDEQEVINGRDGELPAGQVEGAHRAPRVSTGWPRSSPRRPSPSVIPFM